MALRSYDIAYLDDAGQVRRGTYERAADAVTDMAFTAMARGCVLHTARGPVAVEDLLPGDLIETAEAGPVPLLWIGRVVLPAPEGPAAEPASLIRITMDAVGYNRPAQDLLLGTGAEIWSPQDRCFVSPAELGDDETVLSLRQVAEMELFHLALAGGVTMLVNGVAMPSYQPDIDQLRRLKPEARADFAALFPNTALLAEFGLVSEQPAPRRQKVATGRSQAA
ncbi:hypothetical protein FGG78_37380 [Thioclava sp. BHET1]|nr:hypothetical protein FGG78_37380 [Thioclava sp. BHET1]